MANSKPPPRAKPFTAAITGVLRFSTKSNNNSCPLAASLPPSLILKSANSLISAPATKAFSPLPVIIITLVSLDLSASAKALCNSSIVTLFKAFNLLGRFTVIVVIPFENSDKIFS